MYMYMYMCEKASRSRHTHFFRHLWCVCVWCVWCVWRVCVCVLCPQFDGPHKVLVFERKASAEFCSSGCLRFRWKAKLSRTFIGRLSHRESAYFSPFERTGGVCQPARGEYVCGDRTHDRDTLASTTGVRL